VRRSPVVQVVAIVPAKDRADSIAATVAALRGLADVTRVLVVDDGSTDATAAEARGAGAHVLRLPVNVGKGDAVAVAVAGAPDADVFVLVDADTGATAAEVAPLIRAVLDDEADLAIGALPAAGGRGGFGLVRDLAARGIRRATGRDSAAPLSGQRAIRASLLRGLVAAPRFGLEVGMTIDAQRAGARVVEIPVAMEHHHTGRSLAGFRHRARQGADVARALFSRVTTERQRLVALVLAVVLFLAWAGWSSTRWQPVGEPLAARPAKVLLFGMGPLDLSALDSGDAPALEALVARGAVGAMSPRTVSRLPDVGESYLSIGAGARMKSTSSVGVAYAADDPLGTGTAADYLAARTGVRPTGGIVAVGAVAAVTANSGAEAASQPGALGDLLREAGQVVAAVGNSDRPATVDTTAVVFRPAPLAVMDGTLSVPLGTVDPEELLVADPTAPFGVRANADGVVRATRDALAAADVVVVDPGDLSRADRFGSQALAAAQAAQRRAALRRTDAILARVLADLPDDVLVLAVSVAPPGRALRLAPVVVAGPGVPHGEIVAPSSKRPGVLAVTDLAPTILDALGVPVPDELPGVPVRYHAGDPHIDRLQTVDAASNAKERTYYPQAVIFITFIALLYAFVILVVSKRARLSGIDPVLVLLATAAAGYPVATFLVRLVPGITDLAVGVPVALSVLLALALAAVASRRRSHPLAPLSTVLAVTVAVIVLDAVTGTHLHVSSWLGYSTLSAGRFYGLPNTTFAVLAAATLLLGCIHVQYARRRREAVFSVVALFAVVAIVDAAPTMGGDVGGIITLVPLFALTALLLSGRRPSWRTVALVAGATIAVLAVVGTIDSLRPSESQTHFGRFVERFTTDGPGELAETFLRKQSANLRILGVSIWTWMLPIVAVFLLYVLVWQRQWADLLPPDSPLRVGAVAVLVGALLGFLANDSGPIVIALFAVYLPPYLTLLSLRRESGEPMLLEPAADPPPRPAPRPRARTRAGS
jgi:hypothetical protein